MLALATCNHHICALEKQSWSHHPSLKMEFIRINGLHSKIEVMTWTFSRNHIKLSEWKSNFVDVSYVYILDNVNQDVLTGTRNKCALVSVTCYICNDRLFPLLSFNDRTGHSIKLASPVLDLGVWISDRYSRLRSQPLIIKFFQRLRNIREVASELSA